MKHNCKTCGGELQPQDDEETWDCLSCGEEYRLVRTAPLPDERVEAAYEEGRRDGLDEGYGGHGPDFQPSRDWENSDAKAALAEKGGE